MPDVLLADLGCGVPNVVRAGDRDYRLYYVRGGAGREHGTYMATSTDGLTWTPTDTLLTPKDMVDPSVVKLDDGSWLMFTADFPAGKSAGPFFQKLYVGTSDDGFAWDFGDGASGSGAVVSHTYASAGTFTVRLARSGKAFTMTAEQTVLSAAKKAGAVVPSSCSQGEDAWGMRHQRAHACGSMPGSGRRKSICSTLNSPACQLPPGRPVSASMS